MSTAVPITAIPLAPPPSVASRTAEPRTDWRDLARPFLMAGAVFFVIGFAGYLGLVGLTGNRAADRSQSRPETLRAVAPTPDVANPPTPV